MVTSMDAVTEHGGAPVPGFVKALDDGRLGVHWTPVFEDLGRVHRSFAKGWAGELARMARPAE